jgi:hypothetical protein
VAATVCGRSLMAGVDCEGCAALSMSVSLAF